ncbi:hypothetical protein LAZ67_10001506 [Cordylochernes scorpioides]|uniref:Uncharacterized protein n=1 Tax=Cordylochernes scorpioides TaxID=51811 RepID=A0ABY6KWH2_9ARAC|nr:hypothetical protein LAZ67_10001506 [Cordylochernes scorpioides]
MRWVAAKFVPKLLNCDQKQHLMNIANEMLDSVHDDPNLLQRVITGDEAWVYGYDVETKAQSSQWKLPHEPRPKKARQVRSNVKVLLTVFFDCRGVVHHEFLRQGRTVNKEYYLQVMRNLREAIHQKRPDLWKNKNWLLHHDNAPAHTSLLVRDLLAKNNTLMMPQPPYSPDLAPCDFFLFPKLKRPMKGRRYATLDEIKTASKEELKKILKNDFLKCFEDWKNRWHKCIISHGDYFEGDKIEIQQPKEEFGKSLLSRSKGAELRRRPTPFAPVQSPNSRMSPPLAKISRQVDHNKEDHNEEGRKPVQMVARKSKDGGTSPPVQRNDQAISPPTTQPKMPQNKLVRSSPPSALQRNHLPGYMPPFPNRSYKLLQALHGASSTSSGRQLKTKNIIELIDTVKLNLRNLELLGIDEEQLGNMLLTTFILKKIDSNMNKDFELSLKENTFPTLQDLLTFLEKHRKGLDHINGKIYPKEDNVRKTFKTYQVNTNIIKCTYCNSSHKLGTCQEFAKLSLDDRIKFVRSKNLCINCLGVNHYANNCKITSTCKVCNRKHHTTLHHYNYQRRQGPISTTEHQANTSEEQNQHQTVNHTVLSNNTSILETNIFLSTALIKVFNSNNDELMCRALIDSGAQKSLITKTLADKLNITQEHTKVKISGFNSTMQSQVNKIIKVKLSSIYDHFKFETKALIVKDLSNKIPNFYTHNPVWPHLNNLKLADPEFYIPRPIDIIIGADLYLDLVEPGLIKGPRDAPSAMNSKLGWIISGRSNMPNNTTSTSIQQIHINHSSAELDDIVKKIWDAESIPMHKEEMNTEELECENIFRTTTFRDENGRYVVSLPFKLNYNKIHYQLGDSKSQALRRFLSLERRFHQNPVYSQHVREFMQEYLNLGHMEVINEIEPEQPSHQVYYMPYHAVLRDQSTTTKLRVVFDASAKTSTGLSLNDLLYCGPKLQDIFNILIKFRTYQIALTADIEKMYRQIRLNPADCCFQRILWRASPNEPIKEYQLATVTYGTTSAPYLAIKTLKTLAYDEQKQFPQASKAILTNFYVDDMLSGANSVEEAKDLIIQLNQIMRRGGFHLRKWASNVPKVLEALPNEDKYDISMVPIEKDLTINLLGLIWNTTKDVFQVKVQDTMDVKTKRQLLSVIAQFFDPLGIISPSIILLKILMQDAWKLQLDWDDYLPDDIVNLWAQFKKEIGYLSQVMIPRYLAIIPKEDEVRMQLHGFADASAKAYAAVCYLRCETQNDVKIQLLAAKTRVASLKAPTLPCLELCAAHLLSQLVDSIKLTLPFQIKETFLWTDSKIPLCWIQSNPSKWKVYISNRVEKIQKTSRVDQWHHVPGVENPADCASRGIMPSKLVDHHLWWNGPSWLTTFDSKILSNKESVVEESEIVQSYRELIQIHYSSAEDVKSHSLPDSITRFSSYSRMKRTLAWCLRFINNSRYPSNKFSGTLTTKEIRSSELKITKVVQECYFSVEINALLSSKALPKTNKLLCLNPFIDQNGILRVGGRLKLSSLSEFQKHPIILPPKSHVTELIIRQCHQEHFHSSFNLTCSILRRTYWIVNGRSFVKQILKNCVQCFKVNARPNTQLMGELPSSRTTYIRAFARTGVDLAGPILTKPRLPRSRVKLKSYIALFICFATKAIHLELVSDLSTGSFIAALRRFTSRREVIGSSLLTFEELTTFLTQIEATLNQRPLTPLSEDPNDLEALTPAHFLSGPSTSNLPETDNQQANLSINISSRWKHIQELKKLFILRWKKEYVINLQKRGKWKSAKPNVKIGDLVLIMEQSISSSSWILGRVSKTFHGPDMLVRTVELRTGKGLLRRPVNKVAVLPVQSDLTLTTGPAGSMERLD